jgi:deoxyribonuclease V
VIGDLWPGSAELLEELQADLAERSREAPPWAPPRDRVVQCAGVFVTFASGSAGREPACAAAAVVEGPRLVAMAMVLGRAGAPYAPGRLALQRGPLLEAVVRALEDPPDLLLVNATGWDHPRGAGMALHLGAALDLPTIGVTDRPLVASAGQPGPTQGEAAPLVHGGAVVGFVLRTRLRTRPVIAHAGWRTDPETAREVVLACSGRARTPEPLRVARQLARVQRAREEGRLAGHVTSPLLGPA